MIFGGSPMPTPNASQAAVASDDLPAALKARIAAAEHDSAARDFDGVSLLRMALLGIILPIALIVLGWVLLP
jgi:hypothetical protein